jgi:hypothetical protein
MFVFVMGILGFLFQQIRNYANYCIGTCSHQYATSRATALGIEKEYYAPTREEAKKALQENCAVTLGGLIWCPSRAGIIGFSITPENSDHVFEFSVRNSRKGNGLTITGILAKEGYTKEPIDDCETIKELQDKLLQDHQFINEKLQIPVFKKLKLRPWKLTRKVSQRLYYNRDKEEAYGTHLPYAAGEPIPRQSQLEKCAKDPSRKGVEMGLEVNETFEGFQPVYDEPENDGGYLDVTA